MSSQKLLSSSSIEEGLFDKQYFAETLKRYNIPVPSQLPSKKNLVKSTVTRPLLKKLAFKFVAEIDDTKFSSDEVVIPQTRRAFLTSVFPFRILYRTSFSVDSIRNSPCE